MSSNPEGSERFLSHFLEYSRQAGEILFEMKLKLYEEACLPIMMMQAQQQQQQQGNENSNNKDIFIDFSKQKASTRDPTKFVDEADMYVTSLFSQLPSGFNDASFSAGGDEKTDDENDPKKTEKFDAFLYGEIEPVGVRQVAGFMLDAAITASSSSSTTKKIDFDEIFFIDLGSGVGKCVFEMALFCNCHVSSKTTVPPCPRLTWDDKSIPAVSAFGIELEPERATVGVMAKQMVGISPEQEMETLKEKIANQQSSNNGSSSSDDDDGITSETLTDTFGKTIYQRAQLVHGDMLNESLCNKLKKHFKHLQPDAGLSSKYKGGYFAFCCGVAFNRDMCTKIVESVFNAETSAASPPKLELLGGVFLFREWPYGFIKSDDEKREYDLPKSQLEKRWKVQKIVLATSWMNEAPAFLLKKE